MAPAIPPSWRWKITYTTSSDLDRDRVKPYDGSIHLWSNALWIVLKDAKGKVLVSRKLSCGEAIRVGSKVLFASHSALVSACLESPLGASLECFE